MRGSGDILVGKAAGAEAVVSDDVRDFGEVVDDVTEIDEGKDAVVCLEEAPILLPVDEAAAEDPEAEPEAPLMLNCGLKLTSLGWASLTISKEYWKLAGRLDGIVTVAEPPFGISEARTVPSVVGLRLAPSTSFNVTVP